MIAVIIPISISGSSVHATAEKLSGQKWEKLPTQKEIQPSVAEGIKEWEATQEHPTKVAHIDRNESVTFTPSDRDRHDYLSISPDATLSEPFTTNRDGFVTRGHRRVYCRGREAKKKRKG